MMILIPKLQGIIAERGMSQRTVAKALGMNENTFYRKMRRGVFDSDEICSMIELLQIENPADIFFAQDGAQRVPSPRKESV